MGLRLGFIGTGGIAGAHLKNLQTFDDVELAALCDLDAGSAEETAATYGGRAYTDYREMLDTANLDAVYTCTPPLAHGEQKRLACERGLPMFIEKPVAVNLGHATATASLSTRSKTATARGFYRPTATPSKAFGC